MDAPVLEIGAEEVVDEESPSTLLEVSPEAEQEPEAEAPESSADQDTPAADDGLTDEERFTNWVQGYATNPKSITQIPQSQRVRVVESHYQTRERQLVEQANRWGQQLYARAIEDAKAQQAREAEWAEVAQMEEDDPAGFIAWQRKNPEKALAYLQREAAPSPSAGIEAAAKEILVGASPEVMERLKANPEKYPPTSAGLAALARDVAAFSAETDPARRAVEKRAEAVANTRKLPKPEGGGGAPAKRDPDAIIRDPNRNEKDRAAAFEAKYGFKP